MGNLHALGGGTALRRAKLRLCVVGGLLAFGCFDQRLDPVAPSWDANLTVPLLHRSYSLLDLVRKDTSLIHVGAGGQIVYATSSQVRPTYVGDRISIALRDTSLPARLGAFKVNVAPIDFPVAFPWLPQGMTVPIPDTTVSVPELDDTLGTFQSLTFKSGVITLTLQNNLPVSIVVAAPVRLVDSHGIVGVFAFSPDTISPNSARSSTDDLAGDSLDNIIGVAGISLHLLGSGVPVTIPPGTLVSTQLTVSNAKAKQAVGARIPPQRLSDSDTTRFKVDDSTLIRELHIRSGQVNLAFQSHVNVDLLLRYRLLELLRPVSGTYVPYEDSIPLPALQSGSCVINLAGTRIVSQSPELLRSMRLISSVVLPTGSPGPDTLSDRDSVSIIVRSDTSVIADSAIGVLKPTKLYVNTVVPVRFGDLMSRFSGQVNIPSATLVLRTNSTIGFPIDANIRIGARRRVTNDSVFVYVPAPQRRVQVGSDQILFDQTEVGSFLSQFSNGLPREFRIEGDALVNPPDVYDPSPGGVGSVGSNSSLGGIADMQIPMVMGIISGSYIDTLALADTNADGRKDYVFDKSEINRMTAGTITMEVKNAIPAQVGVELRLLDLQKGSLLLVPQSGIPLQVNSASVDAEGNVVSPSTSTVAFQLNESEIRQFNPAEYLSVVLSMASPAGAPAVHFLTSDSVTVRAWSELKYRVNP